MSEAVDTRIVEAKFDSAQFEKGVDRTVKKLDELKKSLNLEETGKSVAQLASKTQEASEKASNALQQLEERFTNFTGMLKQKLLSGIADEIVGVFFKIKNGFESLVSSLSTGQINAGMSKYEQMLTSVRTMIAAGDTEDAAYAAIETLGEYADQTSYSLDQMTSALSKMRAAGVDLQTGTKAVEGISNACAAAGVNATDASRAFFNLAQAYSSGYLKYTDYRSLELLNMTTEKFKLQMLDAASAAGTLKKISDGVYQTVNKNDKKVAAGKKVTVKNLSEALKYNFMNTEAMNKLFGEGFFFDEKEWKKIKSEFKAAGKSEEEALAEAKVRFGDVAVNAYFAAREARSFTDVMNTLKDVVSRGWSKSFEWIFGTLEEATKFFTWLAESNLANAIYNISAFRNAILENWADSGGRDNMLEALENIDELIGRILGHFTIFTDSESPEFQNATMNIGHRLSKASREFKKFTEELDAWFTEERIHRIQKVVGTIGTVLSTIFRALGIAFTFITKVFETVEPVLGKIIDNVDKVVNKINSIFNAGKYNNKTKDGLDSLEIGLNNIITAIEPLIEPLGKVIDFLGEVASFLVEIAAGSFIANLDFLADTLGFVIELFGGKSDQQKIKNGGVGVLDSIKNSIVALGDACKNALTFVKDFFHNLYEDILQLLGIHEIPEGEEGGFFNNIKEFFDTSKFIEDIKKWFEDLPVKINKIIYGEKKIKGIAKINKDGHADIQIEEYFEGGLLNGLKSVKTWITTVLPKEVKRLWNKIDEFLFGKKVGGTRTGKDGKTEGFTYRLTSGFSKWLEDTLKSIKDWVNNKLPAKASEIWNSILDFLFGKKQEVTTESVDGKTETHTERVKEGFSKWLENTVEEIADWITTDLPTTAKEIWNSILDFLFGKKEEVITEDSFGKTTTYTKRVKRGFSKWISDLFVSIKNWFKTDFWGTITNIWTEIDKFIFGEKVEVTTEDSETGETNVHTERVKKGFSAWLDNLFTSVKTWFTEKKYKDVLTNIWTEIDKFIFGEKVEVTTEDSETGETNVHTERVKKGFSAWLDKTVKTVSDWIGSVPGQITKLWDTVLGAIFGNNVSQEDRKKYKFDQAIYDRLMSEDPSGTDANEYKAWCKRHSNPILDTVENIIESLGLDIGNILSSIPAHIINGWNFTLGLTDSFFDNLTGFLRNKNEINAAKRAAGEEVTDITEGLAEQVEISAEASPLLSAIITFGENVGKMVTSTIPELLTEAWTYLTTDGIKDLGTAIKAIFGLDDNWWTQLNTDAKAFGKRVSDKIRELPDQIREAIVEVRDFFSGESELKKIKTEIRKQFTSKDEDGNPIIEDEFGLKVALNAAEIQFRNSHGASGLWGAIKEIFIAGKDAIVELGPDILDGLNKVFEWVGDRLSDVTKIFEDKLANGGTIGDAAARIMGKDGESNSPFIEALTNIGQTLYNLITTIIPDFIKSGIEVLVQEAPKWFEQIKNAFSGKNVGQELLDGFSENLTESADIVDVYAKALSDETEASIKKDNLLDTIKLKKEELEFMLKYADKSSDDYKQLNEQYKKINEAIKKSNDLTDEEVKLSDIGLDNMDLELRTRVKRTERLAELEKIYKNKQDEYYGTIRKLQKNVLDQSSYLKNPEYLRAEADYQEAKEAYEDIQKINDEWVYLDDGALTNMESGLAGVGNILDTLLNFGTSKTTQAIGVIAAIAWLVHELKDVISFTDEVESFGYSAKWTGISIAMAGITAIMGYITYLAAQDDQSKIKHVMSVFDKFTKFIEKLGETMQTIAWIKLGTSGLDVFSSLFGWQEQRSANKAAAAAGTIAKSGSWFGTLFTGLTSGLLKYGLITTGSDVIGESIETLFDSLGDTFTGIVESIDAVLSFFKPAVDKALELKNDIDDAVTVMEGLGELIGKFYHVIDLNAVVTKAPGNAGNDTSMINDAPDFVSGFEMIDSGLEEEIERRIAIVTKIASLMNNLASSLEKMQKVEDVRDQMNRILSVFDVTDDKGSSLFGQVIQKIVTIICESLIPIGDTMLWYNSMPMDFDSVAACFQIIGNAMSIFSDGLTGLTMDNVTALNGSIDVIERLLDAFDSNNAGRQSVLSKVFGGDKSLSTFGKEIKIFGTRLVDFFGYLEKLPGVKDDEYKNTQRAIDFVIQVAKGLSEATIILADASTYNDIDELVEEWGNKLEGFGSNVGAFISAVNGSLGEEGINLERVQMVAAGASAFLDLARSIHELSDYIMYPEQIPVIFAALMQAIAENLGSEDNAFYKLGLDAGSNLDAGLAKGISTGTAIDAAQTLADQIKNIFPFVWKEHSPSKLAEMYARYWDEGLAEGFNKNSGEPIDASRELAKDIIDEAKSVLNDPNASLGDKSFARSILDQMFGLDSNYKFGQELKKEYTGVVEEAVQTINGVTEAQWNKLQKQDSYFDILIQSAKSVWNRTFGREENNTILKKALYFVPEDPEVFMSSESGAFNFLVNSMVWLSDKAKETAQKYIPNLATLFLDSGLLSSDGNSTSKVFSAIEAMTEDISLYTDNLWVKFAGDLAGAYKTAFTDLPEDGTASGWEIAKSLFSNMSSTIGQYAKEHGGIFSEVFGYIKDLDMGKIFGGVKSAVPEFMKYLSGLGTKLGKPIVNFASDTMMSIYDVLLAESEGGDGTLNSLEIAKVLFNNISDTIGEYAKEHGGIFSEVFAYTKNLDIGKLFGGIESAVPAFMDYLSSLGTDLGKPIVNFASDTMSSIYEALLAESEGSDGTTIVGKLLSNLIDTFTEHADDEGISGEVASKMLNIFSAANALTENGTDFAPKITPVLEISDEFRNTANQLGQLLGFNELLQIGEDGTLTVNNTTMGLAEQLEALKGTDYSALMQEIITNVGSLQQGIDNVGVRLGSMKFVINGKEFAYTIGPDINEYLGYEDATRGGRYATWVQDMES